MLKYLRSILADLIYRIRLATCTNRRRQQLLNAERMWRQKNLEKQAIKAMWDNKYGRNNSTFDPTKYR